MPRQLRIVAALIVALLVLAACTVVTALLFRVRVEVTREVRFARPDVQITAAVQDGRIDEVSNALSADPALAKAYREGGMTLLHIATMHKQRQVAELLIRHGADVNARIEEEWAGAGSTPLHLSVGQGDLGTIDLLLKAGARQDLKDQYGRTPKDLASQLRNGAEPVLTRQPPAK